MERFKKMEKWPIFPKIEEEVKEFWDEIDAFKK